MLGAVANAVTATIMMFVGGFLAEAIFSDIPQWGIALHAMGVGIFSSLVFGPIFFGKREG